MRPVLAGSRERVQQQAVTLSVTRRRDEELLYLTGLAQMLMQGSRKV